MAARTAIRTGPAVAGFLAAVVLAAGCGGLSGPTKQLPTPEERAARQAFVEDRPGLDRGLARDLLDFRVSPTDALRRQAYVDARRDLDRGLRRAILGGWVTRRMAPDQVRAAWGEPDQLDRGSGDSVEVWVYRRAVSPYDTSVSVTRLRFEGRRLVDIQVDAAE